MKDLKFGCTSVTTRLLCLLVVMAATMQARILDSALSCDLGKGKLQVQNLGPVSVELVPTSGFCSVYVLNSANSRFFETTAGHLEILPPIDLGGGGMHQLTVEATSNGKSKLYLLSMNAPFKIITSVENSYGFWLDDCDDGRWRLWTADSAFLGDSEMVDIYHYDLIVPAIAMRLEGEKLTDDTPSCKAMFDKRSAIATSHDRKRMEAFRQNKIKNDFDRGIVKGEVLTLAFNYLYTNREKQARQVLDELWPPRDKERIWQWMNSRHKNGFLLKLR